MVRIQIIKESLSRNPIRLGSLSSTFTYLLLFFSIYSTRFFCSLYIGLTDYPPTGVPIAPVELWSSRTPLLPSPSSSWSFDSEITPSPYYPSIQLLVVTPPYSPTHSGLLVLKVHSNFSLLGLHLPPTLLRVVVSKGCTLYSHFLVIVKVSTPPTLSPRKSSVGSERMSPSTPSLSHFSDVHILTTKDFSLRVFLNTLPSGYFQTKTFLFRIVSYLTTFIVVVMIVLWLS